MPVSRCERHAERWREEERLLSSPSLRRSARRGARGRRWAGAMHRRHGSDGDRVAMRQSAANFGFNGQHTTRFGKSRLKYVFTMEGVTLSCGSALLQAANESQPPTVSLTWTSGRKKVFGGVVRVLPVHEGGGARWPRPVSMACSLTSSSKASSRFEARHSKVVLRIEGTRAARSKLVGTLDLATFAGYERTSTKVTIPLEHGAGSLQLDLTCGWLKKSALDDEENSECSATSSRLSSNTGSGSDHESDVAEVGLSHHGGELASLKESNEESEESVVSPKHGSPSTRTRSATVGTPAALEPERTSSHVGLTTAHSTARRSNSFGTAASRAHADGSHPTLSCGADTHAPANGSSCGGATHDAPFRRNNSHSGALSAHGSPAEATPSMEPSHAPASGSMFPVPLEAMEEVLRLFLPLSLDHMQESFAGFDSEDSRFGQMLSRRLGYMDVSAGSWAGNEAEGMRREVQMVVKCPPKPMLPDTTRVHIRHRLQRLSHERLILEREVSTLDVPYGETWSLQERWVVTADPTAPDRAIELAVCAHIYFKSRGAHAT